MFATLDPASRRLRFPREREVIVTDTVGFIRDLPPDLVAAFRATLEELREADAASCTSSTPSAPGLERRIAAVRAVLERDRARRDGPSCSCSTSIDRLPPGEGARWRRGTARVAGLGARSGSASSACSSAPRTSCSRRTARRRGRGGPACGAAGGGSDESGRRSRGTGMYVPERVRHEQRSRKLMDTSDEWIRQRSGIVERRYIAEGQLPADLAEAATPRARSRAPASRRATSTASCSRRSRRRRTSRAPRSSCRNGSARTNRRASTCARSAAASSTRSSVAHGFVASGPVPARAAGRLRGALDGHRHLDRGPRRRGAVRRRRGRGRRRGERRTRTTRPTSSRFASTPRASTRKKLWIEAPGSGLTPTRITPGADREQGATSRSMDGKFVFKHAVTRMPEVLLRDAGRRPSVKTDDVDLFLFHQANLRINEYVAQALEIPGRQAPQQHPALRELLGGVDPDAARRGACARARCSAASSSR